MDILQRITELMAEKGWSEYELSKRSGVPQSTINAWFQRNYSPSLSSLQDICKGFGISTSDFFADGESSTSLTSDQMKMFEKWITLTKKQKDAIMNLIDSI
ncbi:MAG: helix-turn-helix transcriptional regulator [Clostridiales bacterium]|jgi:transcriptional regulator with XRE-family HTH domain|nr:helix-turn-helix transcriptional regulator [Clostridiales bacterium]